MVIDIVLPAVLGLVLVREAGIESYDKKSGNGTRVSLRFGIYQLQHNISNAVVFVTAHLGSSARTSHELEGLSLTFTVRHGCYNSWRLGVRSGSRGGSVNW